MIIRTEYRAAVDSYVLIYSYNGIEYINPLKKDEHNNLTVELLEQGVKNLMNLCILELNDIKKQKLVTHEIEKDKVKFIGVDYR